MLTQARPLSRPLLPLLLALSVSACAAKEAAVDGPLALEDASSDRERADGSPGDRGAAPDRTAAFDPALAAALQSTLEATTAQEHSPGGLLGVAAPSGPVWLGATGQANIALKIGMTTGTHFRIGSITKTFTAALVLLLSEEGKLSLDDAIAKWFPAFPSADLITLKHLLSHTSGIYNYTASPAFRKDMGKPWTPQQLVELAGAQPLLFSPGAKFAYSNTNYIMLGMIIESVTQSTWSQQLHERLLQRLGLDETFIEGTDTIPTPFASGYRLSGNTCTDVTAATHPSAPWAAGAIVSTTADLLSWGKALIGGQVLKPDSLKAMLSKVATINSSTSYGLGMFIQESAGSRDYFHGGTVYGTNAILVIRESPRWAISGALNESMANTDNLASGAEVAIDASSSRP